MRNFQSDSKLFFEAFHLKWSNDGGILFYKSLFVRGTDDFIFRRDLPGCIKNRGRP